MTDTNWLGNLWWWSFFNRAEARTRGDEQGQSSHQVTGTCPSICFTHDHQFIHFMSWKHLHLFNFFGGFDFNLIYPFNSLQAVPVCQEQGVWQQRPADLMWKGSVWLSGHRMHGLLLSMSWVQLTEVWCGVQVWPKMAIRAGGSRGRRDYSQQVCQLANQTGAREDITFVSEMRVDIAEVLGLNCIFVNFFI